MASRFCIGFALTFPLYGLDYYNTPLNRLEARIKTFEECVPGPLSIPHLNLSNLFITAVKVCNAWIVLQPFYLLKIFDHVKPREKGRHSPSEWNMLVRKVVKGNFNLKFWCIILHIETSPQSVGI